MDRKRLLIITLIILILGSVVVLMLRGISRQGTDHTSPTPFPTFTPEEVEQANETKGEAGFTPEEAKNFIDIRNQGEDVYRERKTRLPFIEQLPYETNNYKVQVMATSDTVTITTYGSTPEENLSYRQLAIDWLRSNGANFDLFTIVYSPANP